VQAVLIDRVEDLGVRLSRAVLLPARRRRVV
jgi:hypothetical protein